MKTKYVVFFLISTAILIAWALALEMGLLQ